MRKKKIIVAITGASGSIYAKLLLDNLSKLSDQIEQVGVVMSDNAKEVWSYELGHTGYSEYDTLIFMAKWTSMPHLPRGPQSLTP